VFAPAVGLVALECVVVDLLDLGLALGVEDVFLGRERLVAAFALLARVGVGHLVAAGLLLAARRLLQTAFAVSLGLLLLEARRVLALARGPVRVLLCLCHLLFCGLRLLVSFFLGLVFHLLLSHTFDMVDNVFRKVVYHFAAITILRIKIFDTFD